MAFVDFFLTHPLWMWLAIGGLLLAIEVATGSGWLLWPAASAAAVALFTLTGLEIGGLGGEIALFSVLTILTTLLARQFTPSWTKPEGKDINDRSGDLIGQLGEAVGPFDQGRGRVLVDGAEWLAELEDGGDVRPGGKVKVVKIVEGIRLKVKPV